MLGLPNQVDGSGNCLQSMIEMLVRESVTITADAVKGEYVFVSTVKSSTYTAAVGKTVTVAATGAVSYA